MRIINKITGEDHVKNNALYQKYKILKIDDVYKLELGKFIYLYHVNVYQKFLKHTFYPLTMLTTTIQEINQTETILSTLFQRILVKTRLKFLVLESGIK